MAHPLTTLDGRIASAWAALQGARAAANHCPSGKNLLIEQMAENLLNSLLDDKLHEMTAARIVNA